MIEDIFDNSIGKAIEMGYHFLLNDDNIYQCVRCNAECLSPIVSHFTKEIICDDCFHNLMFSFFNNF